MSNNLINEELQRVVTDSSYKNLRNDPRYIDILKYLNLYKYWKDDPDIIKLEK